MNDIKICFFFFFFKLNNIFFMSNYIMSFENITILIFILNSLADINKSI